jgi:hypothetical protein
MLQVGFHAAIMAPVGVGTSMERESGDKSPHSKMSVRRGGLRCNPFLQTKPMML